MGAEARGQVGADDPLLALEDVIRTLAPDHLLIALRAADRAGWQERGLLDGVVERFAIPVTVFSVPERLAPSYAPRRERGSAAGRRAGQARLRATTKKLEINVHGRG